MNLFPARRILVPVDLSPVAASAWQWAKAVSAPGAALEALYVHETLPAPVLGMPVAPLSGAVRRRIAARLRALCPGASARVDEGDPVAAVLRRARRADLVVMGSHGRLGLDRAVLGSVCEAVARDCPAPVLAARAAPKKVGSVLAPVNLEPYALKGLRLAAEAAAYFGAELVVLHVAADERRGPNPRFFLASMLEELPPELRKAARPRLVQRAGDPVREILTESRRHGLVALTAHRKSLLRDLVLGTTVERVLRHAPVPVLAAPSGR